MQLHRTNLKILTSSVAVCALASVGFAGGWHDPGPENGWGPPQHGHGNGHGHGHGHNEDTNVQLGPRPY